jgi:hypothetical protein
MWVDLVSRERMQAVAELVGWTAQTQRTFKVHGPKELILEPDLLGKADAPERLKDTQWRLEFAGGREEPLSFPELLAFVWSLGDLRRQVSELAKSGPQQSVQVRVNCSFEQLMAAETVRSLLAGLPIIVLGQPLTIGPLV